VNAGCKRTPWRRLKMHPLFLVSWGCWAGVAATRDTAAPPARRGRIADRFAQDDRQHEAAPLGRRPHAGEIRRVGGREEPRVELDAVDAERASGARSTRQRHPPREDRGDEALRK